MFTLKTRLSSLDFQRPQTMSDLEDTAEGSASSLLYLQNELLLSPSARAGGVNRDEKGVQTQESIDDSAYAASHFGVCRGLVLLLRDSLSNEFEEVCKKFYEIIND